MIKKIKALKQHIKFPMKSDWSKFPEKKGIFAKVIHASKFLPPHMVKTVKDRGYWREIASRKALDARLDAYMIQKNVNVDRECYETALDWVEDLIGKHIEQESLTVNTFSQAWAALRQGTSSGYPLYAKKETTREFTYREFVKQFAHFKAGGSVSNLKVFPCSAASRQVVRVAPTNKPRLVWVYPVTQIITEALFAPQLIKAFDSFDNFGWTYKWVRNGAGYERWLRTAHGGRFAMCADFQGFDGSVPAFVIRDCFEMIRKKFKMDEVQNKIFDSVVEYFIHTPIIWHDGVKVKHRGIPSGSYFTQLIGCLVNMTMIKYFMCKRNFPDYALADCNVLGDDSITTWTSEIYHKDFIKYYAEDCSDFGLIVSDEKSKLFIYTTEEEMMAEYLGMLMVDCPPHIIVEWVEMLARMVFPEREDKTPLDTYIRVLGLTWSYGYDTKCYKLCSMARDYLLSTYPYLEESISEDLNDIADPETRRWFYYVFRETGEMLTRFPEHIELRKRYFGYT